VHRVGDLCIPASKDIITSFLRVGGAVNREKVFPNCLLVKDLLLYKMLHKEHDKFITNFIHVNGFIPKNIKHINSSSVGGIKTHSMDERKVPGLFFSNNLQRDTMPTTECGTVGINQAVANQ